MNELLKQLPTISEKCVSHTAIVLRYVGVVEQHEKDNVLHVIENDDKSCVIGVQASKAHVREAFIRYLTVAIKKLGFVVKSEMSNNNCKLRVSVKEKKNGTTIVKKSDHNSREDRNDNR